MKTVAELFELVAVAVDQNKKAAELGLGANWFIDYSGHVNKLSVKYYLTGWSRESDPESLEEKLTEDGVQSLYWFIKNRVK